MDVNDDLEDTSTKEAIDREVLRLKSAQAEKTEIQNSILRGDLVPAEDVEREWTKFIMACRTRLLALPTKLAPRISKIKSVSEIEDVLRSNICEALEELAAYDDGAYGKHNLN